MHSAAQLAQALAEERRRIIADIHDGLGAVLVSLLRYIQAGNTDARSLERRVRAALHELRSAVDALLRELGWQAGYTAVEHPTFITGRAAELSVDGQPLGILGEIHPEVLTNFGLTYPVVLAELTLERVF